uniref:Armadillo repeat-containing protein 1 n=1 Tax=Graphocephala atropunctata TaxID=36148 RepID=A0A1B6MBQ1_9HEMI
MADDFLDIVTKYNSVAKILSGRSVLVKDTTMLPFLAYCLISSDSSLQVVDLAVETLCLLARNDCNITQLSETFGITAAVDFTMARDDLPEDTREKAIQLQKRLTCREGPAYCTRSKTKVQQLGSDSATTTKLLTLHVHGLSKESRQSVEVAVIRVRGVVSVVLDVVHQRCTVRVSQTLSAFDIATAIFEGTGLQTQLVSKNTFGQEVLKPLLESSTLDSEDDLPPYLSEEDSPVKEKAVSQMFLIKDRTSHWLNSAVGFLQKSFYW